MRIECCITYGYKDSGLLCRKLKTLGLWLFLFPLSIMACVGIGRFILFLRRRINTVHDFLCTRNAVSVQVTCTVVTMHKICESLQFSGWCPNFQAWGGSGEERGGHSCNTWADEIRTKQAKSNDKNNIVIISSGSWETHDKFGNKLQKN